MPVHGDSYTEMVPVAAFTVEQIALIRAAMVETMPISMWEHEAAAEMVEAIAKAIGTVTPGFSVQKFITGEE